MCYIWALEWGSTAWIEAQRHLWSIATSWQVWCRYVLFVHLSLIYLFKDILTEIWSKIFQRTGYHIGGYVLPVFWSSYTPDWLGIMVRCFPSKSTLQLTLSSVSLIGLQPYHLQNRLLWCPSPHVPESCLSHSLYTRHSGETCHLNILCHYNGTATHTGDFGVIVSHLRVKITDAARV